MSALQINDFPKTLDEFIGLRRKPASITIIDRVEPIVWALYDDQKFKALVAPLFREQTVEGDFAMDESEICRMIRAEAHRREDIVLEKEKLASIKHAFNVVLRRYNMSRKERLEAYLAKRDSKPSSMIPADLATDFE
jgi:hypothetical protein